MRVTLEIGHLLPLLGHPPGCIPRTKQKTRTPKVVMLPLYASVSL